MASAAAHRAFWALPLIALFSFGVASARAHTTAPFDSLRTLERILAAKEKDLGPDHPEVARALNNLAFFLAQTGSFAEARPLMERVVAIRSRALSPDHPDLVEALNGLGHVLQKVGAYGEAKSRFEEMLAISEKTAGPSSPAVAIALNNIAAVHWDLGAYNEARPLMERAVAIWQSNGGEDHPDYAAGVNNLANLLEQMGRYGEAKPLLEKALAIWERRLDPDDPKISAAVNNVGTLLQAMGAYAEAKVYRERALAIEERARGPRHPQTALYLNALGRLHQAMGSANEAVPLHEQALAIQEERLGSGHLQVAGTLTDLGSAGMALGEYAEAERLFKRALSIREKQVGDRSPLLARSLRDLGTAEEATGAFSRAKSLYGRALAIREEGLGSGHPDVAQSYEDLGRVLAATGERDAALSAALRAEEIGGAHLALMAQALPERQALHYAASRPSGLDLALSLAAGDSRPPVNEPERVWDALVRSRALVLNAMAARHHATWAQSDSAVSGLATAYLAARQRLANLTIQGPRNVSPDQHRALLESTRRETEEAERHLLESSPAFREEHALGRAGLAEVMSALPPNAAMLSYAILRSATSVGAASSNAEYDTSPRPGAKGESRSRYVAFVGRRDGAVGIVPLGAASHIDSLVDRWREEAGREPRTAVAAAAARYRTVGAALREAIWDSVAPLLAGASRVVIVPDGALHLVNFSALPIGAEEYLVESGPLLHMVSAERDVIAPSEPRPEGRGLLALGDPDYDAARVGSVVPDDSLFVPAGLALPRAIFRGERPRRADFERARWERLPGTAREVRETARLWEERARAQERSRGMRGTTSRSTPTSRGPLMSHGAGADALVLTRARASEPAFKAFAPGRRVLHLATHAFFLGEGGTSGAAGERGIGGLAAERKPGPAAYSAGDSSQHALDENPLLLSGLVMAGANRRHVPKPPSEADDGILTADEVAALDLRGVEWAVVSACGTGLGEIRAGEGVFGLRRAFQIAGARTLVMSLWAVRDDAAREWMRALYEARLERGLDTDVAVREASLAMLAKGRRAGKAHPSLWACFVAAGDWR